MESKSKVDEGIDDSSNKDEKPLTKDDVSSALINKNDETEEKNGGSEDQAFPTRLTSWIPETPVWATTFVTSAKDKTKSTFEAMKKDINEFSDILQHEANAIASATAQQVSKQANMLQHLISTSQEEDKEEVLKEKDSQISKNSTEAESLNIGDKLKNEDKPENENKPEKMAEDSGNYFGFGGFMKQIVSTVQRLSSEDTTKDEDEFTQELKLPGRKTALDQCILLQMQNDRQTFLHQPTQNIDLYREWLADFNINEYNGEINMLLSNNPKLREIYTEMVPSQIENHTFWNRYFFKVHIKELDKQLAEQCLKVSPDDKKLGPPSNASMSPGNGRDETWSMLSSSSITTAETEDLDDNTKGNSKRDDEISTPQPGENEELDDWEECNPSNDAKVSNKR